MSNKLYLSYQAYCSISVRINKRVLKFYFVPRDFKYVFCSTVLCNAYYYCYD